MADPLRIAMWNVELSRRGPGLLLRDITGGKDAQVDAVLRGLLALDADILLLTGFDYDGGDAALGAFAARLAAAGLDYPHLFARPPNTGVATGLDLDGDGRLGGPRDAQGYGRFPGEGGMAILSRLPLRAEAAVDLSAMLWRDLPGAIPPPLTPEIAAIQRLSTTGHWIVPVALPDGRLLSLLVWYATPPVFDGPEDRNGRRNHDEAALWLRLFEGALAPPAPALPLVVMGGANLDPADGEGLPDALNALRAHPLLQDPGPRGSHGRAEPAHRGDPALDTALFDGQDGPGGLRVDYVLPSTDLRLLGSGVLWPPPDDPQASVLAAASRHRPVWVDVEAAAP